jgi:tetratricopeptide (TPR) repeat protein
VSDPRVTTLRSLAAALCLLGVVGAVRAHEQPKEGACAAAAQQPEIVSAREVLQRAPDSLKARLALADLLIDGTCYDDAVHVLEDGTAVHARSEELQKRLRTARSLVSERQFFQGLDQAQLDAKLSRHVLRCTRFSDVEACDQALALKPDNVAVVIARGDALLKAQRPLEALDAYRRANALDPANADVATKMTAVQALRRSIEQGCMSEDGETALRACQSILARGAANEFELLRRIGVLQQAANQPAKALDTYIVANSLRRGDKAVSLSIVALVDSTGRSDALALAARGSSLVTLGKVREGIAALQQAQALTPGLPGISEQVTAAQRLLRQEERMRDSQPIVAAVPTRTYSNMQPPSRSN